MADTNERRGTAGVRASNAAERRRATRYEIELAAKLAFANNPLSNCLIRDYCSGGMLVQQADGGAGTGLQIGDQVVLHTELQTDAGARRVKIPATLAWLRGDHLGLTFHQASEGVVAVLRHHDNLSHGSDYGGDHPATRPGAGCLRRFQELGERHLPGLIDDSLTQALQRLATAPDKLTSLSERAQVRGDTHLIDRLRDSDSLVRATLVRAMAACDEPDAVDTQDDGELTLVECDEFERWLEASRVATLLERRFSGQLSALGARLTALRGGPGPTGQAVPFEPEHFTTSLQEVAAEQNLGATARRALFDSLSIILVERLDILYSDMDAALDALGAPAAGTTTPVNRLAPVPRGPSTGRTATAGAAAAVVPPAVVEGQGALPPVAAANLAGIDPGVFEGLLAREQAQRETQAHELVNTAARMPSINESMSAWLKQLEIPMACQAAADQQFFQNRQHPLREIVDALGHLQMFRAHPDPDPAGDTIRAQVSALLESISGGDADEATMRGVARAVSDLTDEQSRLYRRNAERVAETCEGRDRVRRARLDVVAELNRRYEGRQVPEVVVDLLDVGWRVVLELARLTADETGDPFGECLRVLDELVAALGGEPFADCATDGDPTILLERVEAELATTAIDPFRRNAVEACLRHALIGPGGEPSPLVEMPRMQAATDEVDRSPPSGVNPQAWAGEIELCNAIRVGDRLRLLDAPEGQQELRLAWIRSDRGLFALVDHRGLKVQEITLADLAHGLVHRRIKLEAVDGRPLTDLAVDTLLARMEERLTHQAAHDSLTGLINRRHFQAALKHTLSVPDRGQDQGVLLWVDLDQFRLVNDIHGYDTGDRLLIALARTLEQARGAKVLGHLGGDRFAVLLPDMGLDDGEHWAERLCEATRGMQFDWQGQAIGISVSIGAVSLDIAVEDVGAAMQAAENALTAAKRAGGGQVYVYRDDDPGITRRREVAHWVVRVDDALEHGQLHLRCQPIVPLRPDTGLAPHYEILLGVTGGNDEALPVAEFIDAAERYRRMRAVDRWVAKTVIDWIAAQREHMPLFHNFAVNLSGQTASDSGFVAFVREQFQRTGIDPAWLSFEVTETAAVGDLTRTAGIISDLKAMGCKVALDDFGSGLASYSYLKEFPVDWLKIDGVFVRKIAESPEDHAVVKSINEIGHFLGKKTIAEYVADEQSLRLVRELGVDYAQGFGIARPTLMDELLRSVPDRAAAV